MRRERLCFLKMVKYPTHLCLLYFYYDFHPLSFRLENSSLPPLRDCVLLLSLTLLISVSLDLRLSSFEPLSYPWVHIVRGPNSFRTWPGRACGETFALQSSGPVYLWSVCPLIHCRRLISGVRLGYVNEKQGRTFGCLYSYSQNKNKTFVFECFFYSHFSLKVSPFVY